MILKKCLIKTALPQRFLSGFLMPAAAFLPVAAGVIGR